MPSPFPGMDPFIEGSDWEDCHVGLIAELGAVLVPRLRPRYIVRNERRVYDEHEVADHDRFIRSDVAVLAGDDRGEAEWTAAATTVTPVLVNLPMPEEMRETFLTIRELTTKEVVTVIEVLSPTNKRPGSDGRSEYLRKREEIIGSRTHLVELDLLRGGLRMPTADPLPRGDFYALVCRSRRYKAEVYAWPLRHRLPKVPIPLANGDPDVEIDLQDVFTSVYDRAGYDYSLDYSRPVEPVLNESDVTWVASILKERKP